MLIYKTVLISGLVVGSISCTPDRKYDLGDTSAAMNVSLGTQIASADKIAQYRKNMPRFAYERINEIIASSDTLWYDKESMIPTYQDTVGHARNAPIGMRRNSEGAGLIDIIPGGRQMFSRDGKTWEFPFAHTAGTDNSTNTVTVNFLSLPKANGKVKPIVYWVANDRAAIGGVGLLQWRWMFPRETFIGEMIFIKSPNGDLFLTELRTRERQSSGWSTNVFRPFPTAESFVAAIKSKRPNWSEDAKLSGAIKQLESTSGMTSLNLNSTVFPGVFSQSGSIDRLPEIADAGLIQTLLKESLFVSAYGIAWRNAGDTKAFAPTTTESFSIVPNNYQAGIVEVSDQSCKRCHENAQRPVRDFNDRALLYGDIWGSDDIFSFHPFDQSRYSANGNENRSVRPGFAQAGIVVKYDPAQHTEADYKRIR